MFHITVKKPQLALCLSAVFIVYILYWWASTPTKLPKSENVPINLRHLLAVAIEVTEWGGDQVRKVRASKSLEEQSKGKTKEGANDPLTLGDILSHHAMANGYKKVFPGLKVVSEEHDESNDDPYKDKIPQGRFDLLNSIQEDPVVPKDDIIVWIDPLDATQEYTENLLNYVTVMSCIVIKGQPIMGIIHKPFENITAWAWVGHGISSTLKIPLEPPNIASDKSIAVIVSRSHPGKIFTVVKSAFGDNAEVIPAGGAGFKVLQVIGGKADAYIHSTAIKKWDICAGHALLKAIGGQMTALNGKEIDYGSESDVKLSGGLLATVNHHDMFLKKLEPLALAK